MIDREDRRCAVLTEDHAFVWASAGTGKTHTLTLRALFLLLKLAARRLAGAQGTRRRETAREVLLSVVLTTFTRKAAAEMRTRLYGYLDAVVAAPDLESLGRTAPARLDPLFVELVEEALAAWPGRSFEALRSGAEALAERAAELQVSTIHSLAAAILRRHALEAGLPADCRFAREDEDDLSDFEDRLLERWWQTEAVENEVVGSLLDDLLRVVPLSDVRAWSRQVLLHPWIADRIEELDVGSTTDEEAAREAVRALAEILRSLGGSKLQETGRSLAASLERGDWVELTTLLEENRRYLFLKPGVSLRRELNRRRGPHRTLLDNPAALYSTALGCALRSDPLKASWRAWCVLARLQACWLRDAGVRELRMISFDDMIRRAVLLLESAPAVRRAERGRLRTVLVDEFQDTDPWQLRLLACLLGRDDESDHEVFGFFVGDLKQSIYRFRGADVVSIREFHRNYGARVGTVRPTRDFQLRTSFRTREPIIRFVNDLFAAHLPLAERREWLHPLSAAPRDDPRPRWIHLRDGTGPMSAGRAREVAARAVGRLVREFTARGVRFSDILVLTRDNRDLDVLLSGLQAGGVPVVAAGARTFYRHPEVLDLLNLLICLHNPLDHLAVAAVLRSPLVQISDRQLDRLLDEVGAEGVVFGEGPLPPDLPAFPQLRVEALREMARRRRGDDLSDWLARVEAFVPRSAYLHPGDPEGRAAARIRKVIQSFGEECRNGTTPPLVWLLRQRARSAQVDRWDVRLGEDVALADETVDAVRAMTVHKAKGLEAKMVIVYDWNGILREAALSSGPPASVLDLTGEGGAKVRELSLAWGPVTVRTPGFEEAGGLDERQAVEEGRRLAYVAATRAKQEIVFLDPDVRPWAGSEPIEAFRNGASADLVEWALWEGLPETVPERPGPGLSFDREAWRSIWETRTEFFRKPAGRLHRPTEGEDAEADDDWVPTPSPSVDRALAVGRLVHTYLERWVHLPDFRRELLDSLVRRGMEGKLLGAAASILRSFFEGRFVDEAGRPYRDRLREGRILGREVPVFLQHEGRAWHGVMDLVIEEAGGRVVGVDYKTGRRLDPLPESHRQQRSVYSEALRRMGGPEAAFEFWWLGDESVREPKQPSLPFS